MKTQIVYFGKNEIVDIDKVDMLYQKEAAVNALTAMNNLMNTNGGVIDMSKIKKLQSKIVRLNKKICQSVQFV